MFLFDIFIARQHAMCAQHDVVLANPSVCPSRAVCPSHTGIVSKDCTLSSYDSDTTGVFFEC